MTAPDELDPLYAFLRALPPSSSRQLNRTVRLYTLVNAAVTDHGWTPRELAEHCSRNHAGAINHAGIVMHRLEDAATRGPKKRPASRPFCSPECEQRRGLIEDDAGRLIGKCSCRTDTTGEET